MEYNVSTGRFSGGCQESIGPQGGLTSVAWWLSWKNDFSEVEHCLRTEKQSGNYFFSDRIPAITIWANHINIYLRFIFLDRRHYQPAHRNRADYLSAIQMTFIKSIMAHLTIDGTIDKRMLMNPPFMDLHYLRILGVFEDQEVI